MIGVIKRLSINHPRDTLLRLYKSFIRPHLDYRDIIYDISHNKSFEDKTNIKYKTCIAITFVIQRTSREHLYHELGLESLLSWWWCRNLRFFYKIVNRCASEYLADYININDNRAYKTKALKCNNIKRFGTRAEIWNNHFSVSVLMNWKSQKF